MQVAIGLVLGVIAVWFTVATAMTGYEYHKSGDPDTEDVTYKMSKLTILAWIATGVWLLV